MDDEMTKADRNELAQLVRRREKLAKADTDAVLAQRLAEFERQAASEYRADDDDVWREQMRAAAEAVAEARRVIEQRSSELGVPAWTAPTIDVHWYSRGENAAKARVEELRKVAPTRFAADAKAAKVEIERASVEIQTQIVAGGLKSAEARAFLAAKPTAEALMPAVSVSEIEEITPTRDARWP